MGDQEGSQTLCDKIVGEFLTQLGEEENFQEAATRLEKIIISGDPSDASVPDDSSIMNALFGGEGS